MKRFQVYLTELIGFVDRLVLEYKEKIQIKGDSDFCGLLE